MFNEILLEALLTGTCGTVMVLLEQESAVEVVLFELELVKYQ